MISASILAPGCSGGERARAGPDTTAAIGAAGVRTGALIRVTLAADSSGAAAFADSLAREGWDAEAARRATGDSGWAVRVIVPGDAELTKLVEHSLRQSGLQPVFLGRRSSRGTFGVGVIPVNSGSHGMSAQVRWTLSDDRRAVLVPLLLTSGYHDRVDLPTAIAAARRGTAHAPVLGPDRRLAVALADRLGEAGRQQTDAVVLAAAGSTDPAAIASVHAQAGLLAAELGTEVAVGFGSAAAPDIPTAVAAARAAGAHRVAIAPYLLAPGHFADRLATAGADLVAEPLGAHPAVIELVLDRVTSTRS